MMELNRVILGDNLQVMKTFADNSIDSVVTDPPYGLSANSSKDVINNLFFRMFNIMLPNFHHSDLQKVKYSDFVSVLLQGSDLGRFEVLPCIKSWIGMPESAVNLHGDIKVSQKEVNTSAVSTGCRVPDCILSNEADTVISKNIGNYILDFGDSVDFAGSNIFSGYFGEYSNGFFRMPIGSILTPLNPVSGTELLFSLKRDGIDDIIGISANSWGDAFPPGCILTSGAAEGSLMLRFNLTDALGDFDATIETVESNAVSKFVSPKLVRTFAATSDLSSKFKSSTVRLVASGADGADSIYEFQLFLPLNLLSNIAKSFDNMSGFMGKKWDYEVPSVETWQEVLRILKPGGHVLSFGGTRTYHRMVVNMEDAGFEIRDQLQWLYGSGFPKSMDVSKAIDKQLGATRIITGVKKVVKGVAFEQSTPYLGGRDEIETTASATAEGIEYEGWGTALKPANEPICLARKPFNSTVAENILSYGTGALNIDASRIDFISEDDIKSATWGRGTDILGGNYVGGTRTSGKTNIEANQLGRWPANVIHDGSEEVLQAFAQFGDKTSGAITKPTVRKDNGLSMGKATGFTKPTRDINSGSAARFFYCAKASQEERNAGLKHLSKKKVNDGRDSAIDNAYQRGETERYNTHPTVKPIALMEYLVKLITPKGGVVLDPYAGSGTTLIAAKKLGFRYWGIEREEEHWITATNRIARYNHQTGLFA